MSFGAALKIRLDYDSVVLTLEWCLRVVTSLHALQGVLLRGYIWSREGDI